MKLKNKHIVVVLESDLWEEHVIDYGVNLQVLLPSEYADLLHERMEELDNEGKGYFGVDVVDHRIDDLPFEGEYTLLTIDSVDATEPLKFAKTLYELLTSVGIKVKFEKFKVNMYKSIIKALDYAEEDVTHDFTWDSTKSNVDNIARLQQEIGTDYVNPVYAEELTSVLALVYYDYTEGRIVDFSEVRKEAENLLDQKLSSFDGVR